MTTATAAPAARPANLRAYRVAVAQLEAQLEIARSVVKLYDTMWEAANVAVIDDHLGNAWNAAHDAVTALECELRFLELNGYGKPREITELAKLVAANID